uniref:Nucleolar protein 14 n=1 Tax=Clastoptera arizonana TaxID=38151 RepID=A0A1B6DFN0_9HEMI
MFNLAEDEILTHRGQTLGEIEKFDDPRSDDEDIDDPSDSNGRLDAKFVGEAHFGGGIFKKGEEGHKSHANLIEELIAESKKRKAERQQAKEKTLLLTEKLDAEWKDLLPLAFASNKKEEEDSKPQKESYDIVMRELKFEARGIPSDKLRSETDIAKEEKERLEKLEEERVQRMKGIEKPQSEIFNHRSADDLDDGFNFQEDDLNNARDVIDENGKNNEETSSSEESEEDDAEEEVNETIEKDITKKEESIENEEEVDDSDNDSLSDLKDLKENSDDSETDSKSNEKQLKKKIEIHKLTLTSNKLVVGKEIDKISQNKIDIDKFKEELMLKKKLMEEARKELPYTFKVPETYEDLQKLMSGQSAEIQAVIVERIIKCNHPSLGGDNKDKLVNIFAFLLQLLNDAEFDDCWRLLDRLSPHLFDLTQFSPESAAHCISEVLKEKQADFKAHPHKYPTPDTLVFLQLVALLFPTSDARHQVTTSAMVFLCQILFQCKVISPCDVARGLLITTIISQYISLSKRFCGEAISYLQGCLSMAVPNDVEMKSKYPFKPNHRILVLNKSCVILNDSDDLRMKSSDLLCKVCDDNFRLRAINTSVQLLTQFVQLYESLSAAPIIFKPCLSIIQQLPIKQYPVSIRHNIQHLENLLTTLTSKKLQYVVLAKKKPKTLKLYEPDIQKVYDGKKYRDLPEDKLEHEKLVHKYKREMKGALREVRRDKSFLAKIKFHNQKKSDEERIKKVKQIYSWGASQQGELKKLKRKK